MKIERIDNSTHNDLIRANYSEEEIVKGKPTPIRRPFRFWRWVRLVFHF